MTWGFQIQVCERDVAGVVCIQTHLHDQKHTFSHCWFSHLHFYRPVALLPPKLDSHAKRPKTIKAGR